MARDRLFTADEATEIKVREAQPNAFRGCLHPHDFTGFAVEKA
jgi:hypothetical protein